jgi:hypothetical protein
MAGLFAYALIQRYRAPAEPIQRQQIKWVVSAAVFFILVYMAVNIFFRWVDHGIEEIIYQFSVVIVYKVASGTLAASILIAIFRYRLFDIDIIIRRTLIYATLTALLGFIYFVVIVAMRQIITPITGRNETPILIVITTLGIAALFNPLRKRVQEGIDRRFFRAKYDAEQTLLRFSASLRDEVDIDHLSIALIKEVEDTIQPERVDLWLKVPHNEQKRGIHQRIPNEK